jgi:hypothetical protein
MNEKLKKERKKEGRKEIKNLQKKKRKGGEGGVVVGGLQHQCYVMLKPREYKYLFNANSLLYTM